MSLVFCLTLDEVAEALRMSRRFVEGLIASGRLRSSRLGTARRVTPDALKEYIRSCEEEADEIEGDEPAVMTAVQAVRPQLVPLSPTPDPARSLPPGTERIPSFRLWARDTLLRIGTSGGQSGSPNRLPASPRSTSSTPGTPSTSGAHSSKSEA